MAQTTAIAVNETHIPSILDTALTAETLRRQVEVVRQAQKAVMRKGHHYDKIPGCGDKPVLLKPGAEVVALTFQFGTSYTVDITELGGGHREYSVTCTLNHRPTASVVGEGIGSCSTRESKWLYRKAEQRCPECGKETIIKGKKEFGGGWLCYVKKGGCGAKFKDGDPAIENQNMGRIEHDNPADYYNTCLKMAKKRAFVDAILTSTAASDVFTQDLEDDPTLFGGKDEPRRLDMDSVANTIHACTSVEELDRVIGDLGIYKGHPDSQEVSNLYRKRKESLEANAEGF